MSIDDYTIAVLKQQIDDQYEDRFVASLGVEEGALYKRWVDRQKALMQAMHIAMSSTRWDRHLEHAVGFIRLETEQIVSEGHFWKHQRVMFAARDTAPLPVLVFEKDGGR